MLFLILLFIGVILCIIGYLMYISNENDINDGKMNAITFFFNGMTIIILTLVMMFLFFKDLNSFIKEKNIKIDEKYKILRIFIND